MVAVEPSRPASPSLAYAGAVAASAPDDLVAGHFGEPLPEQRSLESGPAVVDRSHRGVVLVTGPDRLSWLHALTTAHLSALRPGEPTRTALLSPHGHLEHFADVVDDGRRTWLLTEPGTAAGLAAFLDSMRFFTRVEVVDASDDWGTLTVVGAEPIDDLSVEYAYRATGRGDRRELVVARDLLDPVWTALLGRGVRPVGHDAWEASRIAAGSARIGIDSDHKTLVHEVGLVGNAVHLDKGCYRGQETVARVHNLGRPPRRLVVVHLDGTDAELPPAGTRVLVAGREVGALTSRARHYELGPIGLALLKRSVRDDAVLEVGDARGAIERDVSSPTAPVDLSGLRRS